MRKNIIATLAAAALTTLAARADNSLTAYGTYWDADSSGRGAGLRYKKTILGFAALDGRAGHVRFDDIETDMVPLEVSLNARLPLFISPYVGVGAGYYLLDASPASIDNTNGYFAQVGVEATLLWLGAVAELRYHDLDNDYFDGVSANVGLMLKW